MTKRWMCRVALVVATSTLFGGCAMDEPQTPCTGADCRSDADITREINAEISGHPELTDWTIQVQTRGSVVYLHGLVDTGVQRDLVESIARNVRGVKGVENSIELRNLR